MKRVALAGAVALLCLLIPAKLDAQTTSAVTFVNAAGANPVDVYVGLAGGTTVGLRAASVPVNGVASLGDLESGSYRVLVCTSVANPAANVAECTENGAIVFLDKKASVGESQVVELVFGATEEGFARLSKFNVDTGCLSPGGRMMIGNVADSDPAVVTLDGTVIDDGLPSGKTVKTSAMAGTHNLTLTDPAALNLAVSIDVASQRNTIAYVRGGPNGYEVAAVHQVDLGCATPPPTDAQTDGTNPAAVNANTSAVSPRFAG